ncbi:hypothetical protein AGLY_013784 [Aphis glycines]|uniref:Uncharacterized protein n=1 Tax=Aphis glycines TaxID=307491 RepID=A0A6G0T5X7_APHGL|nr:hypothetical protein AGLY_013784 [Aphis glycines]
MDCYWTTEDSITSDSRMIFLYIELNSFIDQYAFLFIFSISVNGHFKLINEKKINFNCSGFDQIILIFKKFFFLIFDAMSLMCRIESELSEDIIHLNYTWLLKRWFMFNALNTPKCKKWKSKKLVNFQRYILKSSVFTNNSVFRDMVKCFYILLITSTIVLESYFLEKAYVAWMTYCDGEFSYKGFHISFSNKQIDFVPLKSTCALRGQYGLLWDF